MPIEIRELVIKATVSATTTNNSPSGASSGLSQGNNAPGEDLIKECIDKVIEILKDKNER